jgi:FKBP-type peptidyl-prolyl cis-trans isomerase FkpA
VSVVRGFRAAVGFVALAATGLAVAGCDSAPTSPTNFAPFSSTDLRQGTGEVAAQGNLVEVLYTGWFYDASRQDQKGPQFDSTTGRTPFAFTIGASQVISGWDQGVVGMRVGGLRRLVIPPSLAYGDRRNGPIPPNATLVFEIELLTVQAAAQ